MKETIPATTAYGLLCVLHKAGVSTKEISEMTGISQTYLYNIRLKAKEKANVQRDYYDRMVAAYKTLSQKPEFSQKVSEMTNLVNNKNQDETPHDVDEAAAPEGAQVTAAHEPNAGTPAAATPEAEIYLSPMELRVLRIAFRDWGADLDDRLDNIIQKLEAKHTGD